MLLLLASAVLLSCDAKRSKSKSKSSSSSVTIADVASDDYFSAKWRSFSEWTAFGSRLSASYGVKVKSLGKSPEKRPLNLYTVGAANAKHRIFVMGTVHGREWISPASVYYVMWYLATNAGKDPEIALLLEKFEFLFLPFLNPDGYEFTRTPPSKSETARHWRKNRRALCSKCERGAHGIDLNRNWGIKGKTWGFGATRATSEVYQGKRPFSEPELQIARSWFLKHGKTVDGVLDVHCCAATILPPSYYHGESDELQKEHLAIAKRIAGAMKKVNGKRYKSRARESEFSPTNSGVSVDWIYGEGGPRLVFIVETRGNDQTRKLEEIFKMETRQILPVSKEVLASVLQFADEIAGKTLETKNIKPAPAEKPPETRLRGYDPFTTSGAKLSRGELELEKLLGEFNLNTVSMGRPPTMDAISRQREAEKMQAALSSANRLGIDSLDTLVDEILSDSSETSSKPIDISELISDEKEEAEIAVEERESEMVEEVEEVGIAVEERESEMVEEVGIAVEEREPEMVEEVGIVVEEHEPEMVEEVGIAVEEREPEMAEEEETEADEVADVDAGEDGVAPIEESDGPDFELDSDLVDESEENLLEVDEFNADDDVAADNNGAPSYSQAGSQTYDSESEESLLEVDETFVNNDDDDDAGDDDVAADADSAQSHFQGEESAADAVSEKNIDDAESVSDDEGSASADANWMFVVCIFAVLALIGYQKRPKRKSSAHDA